MVIKSELTLVEPAYTPTGYTHYESFAVYHLRRRLIGSAGDTDTYQEQKSRDES